MSDAVYDASTVLMLRDGPGGFEVFMVRRHAKSSFMANAYVYPGGRVDEEDCQPDVARRVEGLDGERAAERLGVKSPERALGLYLAAVRESFEEAGLLLARRSGEDEFIDLTADEEVSRRFAGYRTALTDYEISLHDLADREDLIFPLDELEYFAHWITPVVEPKRFDTHFFLARAPEHQKPLHDARETTASLWIRPADALERYRQGTFFLAPPTLRTLERLAEVDSIDRAFELASAQTPPTILPHFDANAAGEAVLLLPGDPSYPAEDPAYARADEVPYDITRLELEDGRWRSKAARSNRRSPNGSTETS